MGGPSMKTAVAPAVEVREVRFRWPGADADCLDIRALHVKQGEAVFIHGPSGSGKSTLLSLLAGVLTPQAGTICMLGDSLGGMSLARRDRFRADHVGYLFQQFNLLPYLSVLRNVLLPCKVSARRAHRARDAGGESESAMALLETLDIPVHLWSRPAAELSVGQQQRVAAARSLIGAPEIVIADEPTSALDTARRDDFMRLLRTACTQAGSTLLFVSHDTRLAADFDLAIDLAAVNRVAQVPA
jgi:putative ABC transport system ATP-binding protein